MNFFRRCLITLSLGAAVACGGAEDDPSLEAAEAPAIAAPKTGSLTVFFPTGGTTRRWCERNGVRWGEERTGCWGDNASSERRCLSVCGDVNYCQDDCAY